MPRKTKDAPGRVTPKGGPGQAGRAPRAAAGGPSTTSGRYTAADPGRDAEQPTLGTRCSSWPSSRSALLGIMLNYLGVFPGGASNVYLFVGLGLIVVGFIAATRWH